MDGRSRAARLDLIKRMVQSVEGVPGSVVECGVYAGLSLTWLAKETNGRQVFGFDLFEPAQSLPLTELEAHLLKTLRNKKQNTGKDWDTAFKLIKSGMENAGVDFSKVRLVKGDIRETLPKTETGSVALINLDCDTYYSYSAALEHLWPRLSLGGVAIFHQYADEVWLGAKSAVDEYLQDRAHQLCEDTRWYAIKT